MDGGLGDVDDTTSREFVHLVTQQTRFSFISDILAHPQQLPSRYELEELNPSVSDATVYKHIQKLIDAGIVKEVAPRRRSAPVGLPLEVLWPHGGGARVPRGA